MRKQSASPPPPQSPRQAARAAASRTMCPSGETRPPARSSAKRTSQGSRWAVHRSSLRGSGSPHPGSAGAQATSTRCRSRPGSARQLLPLPSSSPSRSARPSRPPSTTSLRASNCKQSAGRCPEPHGRSQATGPCVRRGGFMGGNCQPHQPRSSIRRPPIPAASRLPMQWLPSSQFGQGARIAPSTLRKNRHSKSNCAPGLTTKGT